jgi:hypothetical protein
MHLHNFQAATKHWQHDAMMNEIITYSGMKAAAYVRQFRFTLDKLSINLSFAVNRPRAAHPGFGE